MFSKHKEQILSSKQKTNVQTSYHESYVKSQQTKGFGPNFQNQRFSQKNFQRRDFKSTEQKSYHRVPHKNKFLNEQKVFQRNNVGITISSKIDIHLLVQRKIQQEILRH